MEALIQLELPLIWWADTRLWNDHDDTPDYIDTVERPTEMRALRRLFLEAKVIERHGRLFNLNWAHRLVCRLERTCMLDYPYYTNVAEWISARCGFSERQVLALIDEANQIIGIRELLGLPIGELDDDAVEIKRAA